MTANIQQTLDGRTIPAAAKRNRLHIYVTPVAFNVTDRARLLGNIPKCEFVESSIRLAGALYRMIPADVLTSLADMDPEEIRETIISAVLDYIKDGPDFPFSPKL